MKLSWKPMSHSVSGLSSVMNSADAQRETYAVLRRPK